jgi:hypothetical protein|tara:strand:- start:899 stop:1144 length:246 start_codon:yes stop_codon:yes gene_type:complete
MSAPKQDNPDPRVFLAKAGEALYGSRWQTELARALGYKEGRQVRQWMNLDRKIPEQALEKVRELLQSRIKTLSALLDEETA